MFSLAMADVALAVTPVPVPSPPDQCFVIKNGALPTCEQNPDGTWNVLYPAHGGNLKESSSTGHTTRDVEIAVVVACVIGIGVIVYRTWLKPEPAGPPTDYSNLPPARLSGASVEPAMPQTAMPAPVQPPPAAPAPEPTATAPAASPAQRLADLNALRNQGGISQEEYEARRQAIVSGTG